METIAKIILGISVLAGLSQFAEAGEKKKIVVTGEVGVVSGVTTIGVAGKRGKYTIDAHTSVGSEEKKALSIGVSREVLKLDSLSLGVGLSANKVETLNRRIKKVKTYQGYDLNIGYDFGKYNVRGTINSNGDIKAGFGFSF